MKIIAFAQRDQTMIGLLDADGSVIGSGQPSAEKALHLVIYRNRPDANAIVHVHTIWNTLLSMRCAPAGVVEIEGYELLKALSGVALRYTTFSRSPSASRVMADAYARSAAGIISRPWVSHESSSVCANRKRTKLR